MKKTRATTKAAQKPLRRPHVGLPPVPPSPPAPVTLPEPEVVGELPMDLTAESRSELLALIEKYAGEGIVEAVVDFAGSGDDGDLGGVELRKQDGTSVHHYDAGLTELSDWAEKALDAHGETSFDNDGCCGNVIFDFVNRAIRVEVQYYVETTEEGPTKAIIL